MELAARRGEGAIPARAIAKAQAIPVRFLEHQLAALHKAGLVESHRGAGGGCTLAREPAEIRVIDAIEALEGPSSPMWCLEAHDDESCPQDHHCGLQELWMRVDVAVRDVLERTTLADLVGRQRELGPLLWPTSIARGTRIG
jgi:Rrf2 family protein